MGLSFAASLAERPLLGVAEVDLQQLLRRRAAPLG